CHRFIPLHFLTKQPSPSTTTTCLNKTLICYTTTITSKQKFTKKTWWPVTNNNHRHTIDTLQTPRDPHDSYSRNLYISTKIQSNYRTHLIKTLYKTISTINIQTTYLQNMIQRQETVDLIRSNEREKIRLNEALMILLLKLDSVKGIDPTVRDARRKVSRRIVGLQEILDGISDERVMGIDELMRKWEEMVIDMEKEVWEEDEDRLTKSEKREMERFCFEKLGFRCMERFLHS
ncbi:hypothetical protein AQUCO_02800131v1, partial [Aquilegia coerulea]